MILRNDFQNCFNCLTAVNICTNSQRLPFGKRELTFTFAICHRPSVCLSFVCLSSITFMRPNQAIEIFGNVFVPFDTLATN